LPDKSPVQFNVYLSAIERDLPQQDNKASAMTFYSKLTKELKRQFKTSDIPIPETRAKCVAVAQHIWDRLHRPEERKSSKDKSSLKYPHIDSKRDRKDCYHLGHCHKDNCYKDNHHKDNWNKEKKPTSEKELICFKCNKPGYYATSCPDLKESSKRANIQSVQQGHSQSIASSRSSSRSSSLSGSEVSKTSTDNSDSSDSLN
jgi:hypothetical protein